MENEQDIQLTTDIPTAEELKVLVSFNNKKDSESAISENTPGKIYFTTDKKIILNGEKYGGDDVKYNRKKTKLEAIDAAEENPNTIYFTKESEDATSGSIVMGGVEYGSGELFVKALQLTQAEYDAIETKDANTLYIITDA